MKLQRSNDCTADRIDLGPEVGQRPKRLQFAGEQQPSAVVGPVQRLLAQAIASERERAAGGVPRSEREHAVRLEQRALDAPRIDRFDQGLGVAVPAEANAMRLELSPDGAVVVDLAVVGDHPATRRAVHRLRPEWAQIDDRETAMAECDVRAIAPRRCPDRGHGVRARERASLQTRRCNPRRARPLHRTSVRWYAMRNPLTR